jgi:predicted transporter
MDLNIILWMGGMLFSLGIFAVKVGFGLGFSGIRWKGIFLTLSMYLMLFVLIAVLSERLIQLLEPVLRKGPYLHALMAAGMIGWGILLLRRQNTENRTQTNSKFKSENLKIINSELPTLNSLFLLVPCPVCLTAMTFSTWAALSVIKLPAYIVGLVLGIVFVGLSLLFLGITRLKSSISPRISLGLSMMGIGIYFMASLVLPAKIEEARGMYQSFLTEGSNIALNNSIGVFALLFVALVIGYLTNKKREVKK